MSKHDGGPAFPTAPENHGYQAGQPAYGTGSQPGLSLRDYFAAAAMQGMLASGHQEAIEQVWIATGQSSAGGLAMAAYGFADAMLAAREAKP